MSDKEFDIAVQEVIDWIFELPEVDNTY